MLVDELVLEGRDPRATALIDAHGGRTIAFGQLADGARRVARRLAARGIGPGDVVALSCGNEPDYAVALYGVLGAGATAAHTHPSLTAGERERQFALTRPRLVVEDPAAWVRELLEDGGGRALPARDPDAVALLYSSSGTTGLPKVAAHTHAGTTAFLRAIARVPSMELAPDDVVGNAVPYTHLFGSAVVSHALAAGASVVGIALRPGGLEDFVRTLAAHRVTVAPVTPPLVRALAREPLVGRHDLSALRLLISSAGPCAPELQEQAAERLGCRVVDCLGSTEAWCYAPAATPPVRGSCGAIAGGCEARIVESGELWIRGPQVMRGYLGHDPLAGDWLRTGDVVRADADGNLFMVDRLKELIKVGGASVAPAEVERELGLHPAVADAAVVGRPDAELGEVPVAYVALREPVAPGALRAWLHGRLAPWKQLHDVIVVDAVPRTPAGKILRRELIARERAQALGTRRPSSARRVTPSLPQAADR